jgi:hypothetical protein
VREQHVEVGVRPALAGAEPLPVAENPAVGVVAVLAGVAKDIATVELVQPVRARPGGQPNRPGLEQLLELLDDLEDADLLVLVEVDRDDTEENAQVDREIKHFAGWRKFRVIEERRSDTKDACQHCGDRTESKQQALCHVFGLDRPASLLFG